MRGGVEAAALGFRFLLAFVFLSAAIPKLLDRNAFVRVVAAYRLLPRRVVRPVAATIPWLELALAGALLLGLGARVAAAVAAALLLAFAAAITVNLRRGRDVECGCMASASEPISWLLASRDLLLAASAALCAGALPASLAIDSLWSADGRISPADTVALAIVGVSVAVAGSLAVEALRARRLAPVVQSGSLS